MNERQQAFLTIMILSILVVMIAAAYRELVFSFPDEEKLVRTTLAAPVVNQPASTPFSRYFEKNIHADVFPFYLSPFQRFVYQTPAPDESGKAYATRDHDR